MATGIIKNYDYKTVDNVILSKGSPGEETSVSVDMSNRGIATLYALGEGGRNAIYNVYSSGTTLTAEKIWGTHNLTINSNDISNVVFSFGSIRYIRLVFIGNHRGWK